MKTFGIGLSLALLLTGAAWAEDEIDNQAVGWIAPKDEAALRAKWPRTADGHLIYGTVLLDCAATSGHADDCVVKGSKPASPLLESAAPPLAALYTSKDDSKERRPLELSVLFDTPPDWLKKPTLDDLMAVYPSQASKKGVSGGATIKCIVQTTGLTRDCTVVKEDRPGLGFGPAAVVMSRTFLFKPALRDSQPVEAEVTVPINFKTYDKVEEPNLEVGGASRIRQATPTSAATVLGEAVWSKTPTVAEILVEIDKKVGDKFAEGLVVFQCRLDKKSGKLGRCVVANASPGMVQFSDVAKSLVPKFQADPTILAEAKGDVLVNLAFAFPDMTSPAWGKRYLTHPRWNKALGPDSNVSTFPETARKAGLKTGSATVDCVVAGNGALTRCETVRESNPNVGFGETAIQIAQTFVANPWNEDGLPVDGAHVRMPIQMDYAPPSEGAPPAATPTPATKP